MSPELQPHFAHPNTPWSSLSPLHPQAQCYILCLDGSSLALGHPGQPLLLWDCRFEDTAMGVAACQAKIHPVPSSLGLSGAPHAIPCRGSRRVAVVLALAGHQCCLHPAVKAVPIAFLSALPSNIPRLLCLCFTFINITS